MAKLPGFMFYPGDWMKEPCLKVCTHAAKGVYMDMLCLMFECEERGVLATAGRAWSDEEIARAVGGDQSVTIPCVKELVENRVVRRNSSGAVYSARMVRDENTRKSAAERQRRKRHPDICHGNVTPPVTPLSQPISFSSSSSDENEIAGGPKILDVQARDFIQKHPLLPPFNGRMHRDLCELVKLKGWPYAEASVQNEAGKFADPIHEILKRVRAADRRGGTQPKHRSAVAAQDREDR